VQAVLGHFLQDVKAILNRNCSIVKPVDLLVFAGLLGELIVLLQTLQLSLFVLSCIFFVKSLQLLLQLVKQVLFLAHLLLHVLPLLYHSFNFSLVVPEVLFQEVGGRLEFAHS
jgi:hypothetical protein